VNIRNSTITLIWRWYSKNPDISADEENGS